MTESDFAHQIRAGELCGVYFLYGDEDYLKNHRVKEAKRQTEENDPFAAFNLAEFSFGEDECDNSLISDFISSPPVMSEKKLIIISFSNLDSVNEKLKSAMIKLLREYENLPELSVIVKASSGGFDYGSDKKPSSTLKTFSEFANTVRFDYQPVSKLISWLTKHAEKYSLILPKSSAELLINTAGRSMYSLSGEISKVSAYAAAVGKREITPEDIALCCSSTDEDDAFKLANAVTDGNTEEAFRCLGVKIRLRCDPYVLLGQITRTFTDLAAASAYLRDGRDVKEFAKETKIHEFRAGLYYKAAAKASPDYFTQAVTLCLNADRTMKTTSLKGYGEIEKLIGLTLAIRN